MALTNKRLGLTEHVGMILHVRGTFTMDTSMDEVLIWNPETKSPFTQLISGDTFAEVDASDELKLEYRQFVMNHQLKIDELNRVSKLRTIKAGSVVKVVRGRKVAKGTVFTVKKVVESSYGNLVFLDDSTFTYESNLEIEFEGKFIEPEYFVERKFYFQAV